MSVAEWENEGGAAPRYTRRVTDAQEAFERAKRAWDELNEVWERGALQSEEARRALHGLREALDGLIDFTQQARDEASEGDGG